MKDPELLHNARSAFDVMFEGRSRIPKEGSTARINWHTSVERRTADKLSTNVSQEAQQGKRNDDALEIRS
jgi:hypothetical protein